jgi:hypothetical protein
MKRQTKIPQLTAEEKKTLGTKRCCVNHPKVPGTYACDVCQHSFCFKCRQEHLRSGHNTYAYPDQAVQLMAELKKRATYAGDLSKQEPEAEDARALFDLFNKLKELFKLFEHDLLLMESKFRLDYWASHGEAMKRVAAEQKEQIVAFTPELEQMAAKEEFVDLCYHCKKLLNYPKEALKNEAQKRAVPFKQLKDQLTVLCNSFTTACLAATSQQVIAANEKALRQPEAKQPVTLYSNCREQDIFRRVDCPETQLLKDLSSPDLGQYKTLHLQNWLTSGDATAKAVAAVLQSQPNISRFYLGTSNAIHRIAGGEITDLGARVIADAVQFQYNLAAFYLSIDLVLTL